MSKELGTACLVGVAAFFLVVAALLVYIAWLHYRLHHEISERRLPEVLRDAQGRRIKERL
jgi:hypothetical protein